MSRLPYFLDNRLTVGGEVVGLTHSGIYPYENSWYSFLLGAESSPSHNSAAERIRSTEKKIHLIATATRDLPACSIVQVNRGNRSPVWIEIDFLLKTNKTHYLSTNPLDT
jgi:hypothetical protein